MKPSELMPWLAIILVLGIILVSIVSVSHGGNHDKELTTLMSALGKKDRLLDSEDVISPPAAASGLATPKAPVTHKFGGGKK